MHLKRGEIKERTAYLQTLWVWRTFGRAFSKASRVSTVIVVLASTLFPLVLLVVLLSEFNCFTGLGTTLGFGTGFFIIDLPARLKKLFNFFSMLSQASSCFLTISG